MKTLAIIAVVALTLAAGIGGYEIARHHESAGNERPIAFADAQEIIGAYNREPGSEAHLVWVGRVAPHIWRFRVKVNGTHRFGCEQVNVKQFWHGQGTAFHGFGKVDDRLCPSSAGASG
jgi:hypothetical protein